MPEPKVMPSKVDLLSYVRNTYLFESLDEETFQALSQDLSFVSLEPGENLFRQGDISDSIFLVINGLLQVAIFQEDGSESFVGQNKPGQLVGEMGVFTGEHRTASIYAHTDSHAELVKISESAFSHIASVNSHNSPSSISQQTRRDLTPPIWKA